MRRGQLNIVSTGDPVEDEKVFDAFMAREERLNAGLCANGCGRMDVEDPHTRTCPACGFTHVSGVPHGQSPEGPQ